MVHEHRDMTAPFEEELEGRPQETPGWRNQTTLPSVYKLDAHGNTARLNSVFFVGKRNSPVIEILRRGKNWTRICEVRAPRHLDTLARKWSTNTSCESGVGVISGEGKAAVVGGRSGSVLSESGLRGKTGWGAMRDSGLRSARDSSSIPDGRHIRTRNRASRGDNYYKSCIRIRIPRNLKSSANKI